ncbi:MAG: hypothetical protein H0T99_01585 [Geodermatophilaceae bacterium]|nr:hypothetical protein [Geodermatophilaceae bacterium]
MDVTPWRGHTNRPPSAVRFQPVGRKALTNVTLLVTKPSPDLSEVALRFRDGLPGLGNAALIKEIIRRPL